VCAYIYRYVFSTVGSDFLVTFASEGSCRHQCILLLHIEKHNRAVKGSGFCSICRRVRSIY